jgi:hypothetical protein
MTEDGFGALRANLARHSGPARIRPLVELGQALVDRHTRVGPGTPFAKPLLDEAIQVFEEACGYLEERELLRAQVAFQLGWLMGIRSTAHGGPDVDRDRGIQLLDEALAHPRLPPMMQGPGRLVLGQMLISRALRGLTSGGALMGMTSPGPKPGAADADRGVACLRAVVDGPVASAELMTMAKTMLGVAEALQSLLGGAGGLDLNRMMQAFAAVQELQQQMAASPLGAGFGMVPNVVNFDVALPDPLDRPVVVVEGAPQAGPTATATTPPPRPPAEAGSLRAALFALVPGYAGLTALLADDAPAPDVDTVDELVALACELVEAPDACAVDHLLVAAARYLRAVVEGGGWTGDDDADERAAAEGILLAADGLPTGPPEAVVLAVRLATLLDTRRPSRGVRERLREALVPMLAPLRKAGVDGLVLAGAGTSLLVATAPATSAGPTARVLVVGGGEAPAGSTASRVRSVAQAIDLAARVRRRPGEAAVFVANPRGDRPRSALDAMVLRRTFYPRSVGLGQTAEHADGAGTRQEVRDALAAASMLHLGCGVTAEGALELAGSAVLDPAGIGPVATAGKGGVAVLPPTATEVPALVDALFAAGFADVVGIRGPVPDDVASVMYFLLHSHLVDEGRDPAAAVKAVGDWMADPRRTVPAHLPAMYDARRTEPAYAGALVHYGV